MAFGANRRSVPRGTLCLRSARVGLSVEILTLLPLLFLWPAEYYYIIEEIGAASHFYYQDSFTVNLLDSQFP